jgi:hypothetical protein
VGTTTWFGIKTLSQSTVSYWVDAKNRIVRVSNNWNAIAAEQQCETVDETRVLNRPLDLFLKGDPTVMLLDALLKRMRLLKTPVVRDYRCDTPDLTRYYQMTMEYEEPEFIKISHILKAVEPKTVTRRVSFTASGGQKRCSMCGRLKCDVGWVDLDDLPDYQQDICVFYGVCEDCQEGRWRNKF